MISFRADYETLGALLLSIFPSNELETWLEEQLQQESHWVTVGFVRRPPTLEEKVHDTVRLLDRQGKLNREFFDKLALRHPTWALEIYQFSINWRAGHEIPRPRTDDPTISLEMVTSSEQSRWKNMFFTLKSFIKSNFKYALNGARLPAMPFLALWVLLKWAFGGKPKDETAMGEGGIVTAGLLVSILIKLIYMVLAPFYGLWAVPMAFAVSSLLCAALFVYWKAD